MKSSCCNAEIKETHGCDSDYGHQGKCDCDLNGVTWWYQCEKCKQPCDPNPTKTQAIMGAIEDANKSQKELVESVKQDTQETWGERFDKEFVEYAIEKGQKVTSAYWINPEKGVEEIKAFIKKEIEEATKEAYEKARGEERERCIKIVESLPVPHCACEKTSFGICVICVHKKIIQCSKDKIIKQIKLTK